MMKNSQPEPDHIPMNVDEVSAFNSPVSEGDGAAPMIADQRKERTAKVECPPSFRCPITQEVMSDPVCTCDGHTFERGAIEQWLTGQDTSPLTGVKLEARTLIPNVALRNAIDEYFSGHVAEDATKLRFADLEFETEIGAGSAKTVYEARWRGKQVAALKMKRGTCDMEAGVLTRLSKHPSLIRFYGVASDTVEQYDYLVTEFATRGSLNSVLEQSDEESKVICFGVMMAVAHQICEGMEAVASEGLIHRDLACRNVLCMSLDPADPSLTDVKVCDFGLSKSGNIFYGGDNSIPVRWMPPEALQRRRWSEKSDVWSFGVTLWELFSYGCVPFADIGSDDDVISRVVNGERLPQPKECPEPVYKVMQACWQKRPDDRPTFRSLRILLRDAERDVSVEDALNARSDRKESRSRRAAQTSPKEVTDKIEKSIQMMRQNPRSDRVQEEGARMLANLAGTPFGRHQIAKNGGIETLVECMKLHLKARHVQECAVAALSNLSASSPENQVRIAQVHGIKALVNAMRTHIQQYLVQQYGATALRNLTLHNAHNKVSIASEGGIVALIQAMTKHPYVAAVQQYAADALQNIALHNAENKLIIESQGGIPTLIQAMRNHRNEARVQQYACFALANLAANNAQNATKIAANGAIPDIVKAMINHRGKPGVQRYAASALKYLAGENPDNQGRIAAEDGIKALIAAMTTHRTNDAVQQYAASALKNLAANNSENKTIIAEEGGIGILLAGMRSHRMKPLVQQHAASALQNLAGNHAENKTRIAQEGGIPLIIAAMNNHPQESQVQRYAASALKNLSSDNAQNKLLIAREGGIEALIAAIVHGTSEPEVQQYAAGALQNIAANNAFTKSEVVRHGGVAALERIVQEENGSISNSVKLALESALRVMKN